MKLFKVTAIIIAILFALGLSAIILAVILIDPNDYKDRIAVAVKDASGADLLIEGDIGLSVFPWIGLELGKVTIKNAEGYDDPLFGQVAGLQIRVALLPLLKTKVEIGKIKLDGLRLNLERKVNGNANWDDLASKKKTAADPQVQIEKSESSGALPEIIIGGIEITDAQIQWHDAQAATQSSIENFNLTTGRITLSAPIVFETGFILNNAAPKTRAEIQVSGEIAMDMVAEQYALNNLNFKMQASGAEVPGGQQTLTVNTTLKADLKQQTAAIDPLKINIMGLDINGRMDVAQIQSDAQATGKMSIANFSPRKLMVLMGSEVPDTTDKTVLTKMQIGMSFSGSAKAAALSDIKVVLDDTTITGSMNVKNLNEKPALEVKLLLDAIDADRYLPPALDTESTVATNTTTGDEPIDLPMETLRELDAKGELKVGEFKMMNLSMKNFNAQLLAKDGVITFKPLNVDLYEGAFSGDAVIDARKAAPQFAMNIKLTNINSTPLLADYLQTKGFVSGQLNLSASIKTQGNSVNALKQALNGQMDFQFKDGALQGVNINERIRQGRALLKGEPYAAKSTDNATAFGTLNGQADIINGVVHQKTFVLAAPPRIQVNGNGTADLNTEKLDYRLQVNYFDTPEDTKAKTLPLAIKGSFDAPSVSLDIAGMRKQAVDEKKAEVKQETQQKVEEKKDEARDKLKDQLRKKLKF